MRNLIYWEVLNHPAYIISSWKLLQRAALTKTKTGSSGSLLLSWDKLQQVWRDIYDESHTRRDEEDYQNSVYVTETFIIFNRCIYSVGLFHHYYCVSGTFNHGLLYTSRLCTKLLWMNKIVQMTPILSGIAPFYWWYVSVLRRWLRWICT